MKHRPVAALCGLQAALHQPSRQGPAAIAAGAGSHWAGGGTVRTRWGVWSSSNSSAARRPAGSPAAAVPAGAGCNWSNVGSEDTAAMLEPAATAALLGGLQADMQQHFRQGLASIGLAAAWSNIAKHTDSFRRLGQLCTAACRRTCSSSRFHGGTMTGHLVSGCAAVAC